MAARHTVRMPRFVLLRHECPPGFGKPSHWDLLLEEGEALLAWSVAALPATGEAVAALKLPDHRLTYLEYEGPVSGGRGEVFRVDAGDFSWMELDPSRLAVELRGVVLRGRFVLEERQGDSWSLGWESRP
jgi:hypothetical protein